MFGVLRNVSQSENLRPRLMQVDLIKVLSNYLAKDKFLVPNNHYNIYFEIVKSIFFMHL